MSTTVTYKGETLTTVSNDTAVLETGGTWLEDDLTLTDVTSGGTMQSKSNIDPTTSSQTITPDTGYDGLSSVQINAMPTGTAGTPTATKGTVSNHSIAVTPSVTNTTGYITGSTINGTAVTVSASELDSGSKSITANGNSQDVVGYASVDVAVPNSYSASDEGKVVDNGALVSQTAHADVTPTTSDQTISTTTNNSIKVIGDADLVAGNIKKDVEIFGVTGSYEGGGGGISVDDIVTNTAPSGDIVLGSSVTEIKNYSLYGAPITSITGANVTSIGSDALENTNITSITDANFPKLGVDSQFSILLRCKSAQYIELTGEKIALNSGSYALRYNTGLITAKFPNAAKNVGASVRSMGSYCFAGCTALTLADCGYVQNVSSYAFSGDTNIKTIILRHTSVVPLGNQNAFNNTPFASGGTGGTVYVPQNLISSYQTASNWSTLYAAGTVTFVKIEGSIYE